MTPDDTGPPAHPIVLLVEDDPRIASFVTRALSARSLTVEWVDTGGAALTRIEAGGVATVVLDLGLPDMDGLDVLRTLRSQGSELPVVVVTARNDPADRSTSESLGVRHYLRKPFPLAELLAAVTAATVPGRG